MGAAETRDLGLGPIDQVAYVVESMERALPRYEAMFGPFQAMTFEMKDCTIRGRSADCTLRLAINNSGPIEIELIEVLAGETTHSEHLKQHGEGLHHVRFRVGDLEPKVAALEAAGYRSVMSKRFDPTLAFAYLESPSRDRRQRDRADPDGAIAAEAMALAAALHGPRQRELLRSRALARVLPRPRRTRTALAHEARARRTGAGSGSTGRVQWDAHLLHDERGVAGPAVDLLEWQEPRPTGRPARAANQLGLYRLCLSHPDVDALHARMRAAGVRTVSPPAEMTLDHESGLAVRSSARSIPTARAWNSSSSPGPCASCT